VENDFVDFSGGIYFSLGRRLSRTFSVGKSTGINSFWDEYLITEKKDNCRTFSVGKSTGINSFWDEYLLTEKRITAALKNVIFKCEISPHLRWGGHHNY